jgi:hypothetical protein
MSRIPHFLDNRLADGDEAITLHAGRALPLERFSDTLLHLRVESVTVFSASSVGSYKAIYFSYIISVFFCPSSSITVDQIFMKYFTIKLF